MAGRLNRRILASLSLFAPFLGLVFVYLFFGLYELVYVDGESSFATLFSRYNLNIVAAQTTIVALAALGMTLVIISGGIDLSPGSSIALTTTVIGLAA